MLRGLCDVRVTRHVQGYVRVTAESAESAGVHGGTTRRLGRERQSLSSQCSAVSATSAVKRLVQGTGVLPPRTRRAQKCMRNDASGLDERVSR